MNLRPRRREDPEINLINFIDVLLVLLIFFMVSTTFNQEGRVKVQLPQASTTASGRNAITISEAAPFLDAVKPAEVPREGGSFPKRSGGG